MRGWFRKQSKPAYLAISGSDRLIAAMAGFTPEQWAQLPELAKRDHRENVTWNMP